MKILIFGNPLIEKDSLPLKLLPKLKEQVPNIEFIEFDPTEGLEKQGRSLIILDCVEDIEKVQIIDSIDKIQTNKLYSMHDFDLGYNLKLLKKLNLIDDIKIIGVPMNVKEEDALIQISEAIKLLK